MRITDYGYSIAVRISNKSGDRIVRSYPIPATQLAFDNLLQAYPYWSLVLNRHGRDVAGRFFYGDRVFGELLSHLANHRRKTKYYAK